MGNYFVMSTKFDKCDASDFGFVLKDATTALNPKDNSLWVKISLYDFGWGKENGFYKEPLPCFDSLFEIMLYSTDREDMYGSAAVILERFADDLLRKCETYMNDHLQKNEFKRMIDLFDLKSSVNRSTIHGKTFSQIQNDYTKWKKISEVAKTIK